MLSLSDTRTYSQLCPSGIRTSVIIAYHVEASKVYSSALFFIFYCFVLSTKKIVHQIFLTNYVITNEILGIWKLLEWNLPICHIVRWRCCTGYTVLPYMYMYLLFVFHTALWIREPCIRNPHEFIFILSYCTTSTYPEHSCKAHHPHQEIRAHHTSNSVSSLAPDPSTHHLQNPAFRIQNKTWPGSIIPESFCILPVLIIIFDN